MVWGSKICFQPRKVYKARNSFGSSKMLCHVRKWKLRLKLENSNYYPRKLFPQTRNWKTANSKTKPNTLENVYNKFSLEMGYARNGFLKPKLEIRFNQNSKMKKNLNSKTKLILEIFYFWILENHLNHETYTTILEI